MVTRALAIETSTRQGSLALAWDDERVTRELAGERAHASDLLPTIAALLEEREGVPQAIFVGTGPGSYTGLRIASATALGLARVWNAQLCGVPSLAALAERELTADGALTVVLDARAGRFYHARYERREGALLVASAPRALRSEELELVPSDLLLFDAGAAQACGRSAEEARSDLRPYASEVLARGLASFARAPRGSESVQPLYLRAFGER